MKDFYRQKGAGTRKLMGAPSRLVVAGALPSGDGRVCEAGDLTSAEQVTPD